MILIEKLIAVLIVIFKGKINIISRHPVFSLPVALSVSREKQENQGLPDLRDHRDHRDHRVGEEGET